MTSETPSDPEPESDLAALVDAWAVRELAALQAQAEVEIARYWALVLRQRQEDPRSGRARLAVRAHRQRNPAAPAGSFTIDWYRVSWAPGAKSGVRSRYLPRGPGDRYPRSTLAARGQPWEVVLADRMEERFARLRRLARSIGELRKRAKAHARLERRLREELRELAPAGRDADGSGA